MKENSSRMIEMGFLVLALPFLTKAQLQRRISISGKSRKEYNDLIQAKKPILLLVPHFTLYEYIPMIPGAMEWTDFNIAAIFRPLKKESLNKWVQYTREKYGVKLYSRQKGFNQARNVLAENGVLSVLFDQNARHSGTLMTFFRQSCFNHRTSPHSDGTLPWQHVSISFPANQFLACKNGVKTTKHRRPFKNSRIST